MLFRIEVQENASNWRARITAPDLPDWVPIERSGAIDAAGYPLPPSAEIVAPDDPSLPLRAADGGVLRAEAHERFIGQEPRAGECDVEALGGYLFGVLLGEHWDALAIPSDGEAVRLRLSFPPGTLWPQLPWELMIGPSGPLVERPCTVSIARVISPARPLPRTLPIDIPLRVLFVMGREVDNQLRPVSEYLNVLRQLQSTIGNGTGAIGVTLHTRLLLDATTDEIEAAVRDFKPTVVHVIAHGQISGDESVVILTRYEASGRTNPKTDPVAADRFAQSLCASNPAMRPHAVILNACNTARLGDVPVSFAAALVRLGIPLALGMAGEVADTACRLFTRQFYSALVEQQPVDVAAAKGRRAALLHFRNYKENFDWGRAVFCQADGIDTKFNVNVVAQSLIRAAEALRPKRRREPFCGRVSWLPKFRELFSGAISNLAIASGEEINGDENRKLGKSRLLEEVMWHSVLEGWIPVLIDQHRPRFSNLMQFGVSLFELLEKTREIFGLERVYDSAVVRVACDRWELPYAGGQQYPFLAARDKILALLEPQQKITDKVTYETIRECLLTDIKALHSDVEAVAGVRKGVLLLWDRLDHQETIGEECVRGVKQWGFGSQSCPAPVVFTYAIRSSGGKKLLEEINDNNHIEIQNLARYDELETKMACRQFLAWSKCIPSRAKRTSFEESIGVFEETVDGYPSNLFSFDQGIRIFKAQKLLIECDDASIVGQYP